MQKNKIDERKKHKRAENYPEELEKEYICKESSLNWLKSRAVGYDGEGILIGAQATLNSLKRLFVSF